MKIDNFITRVNKDGNVATAEVTSKNNKEINVMKLIMILITKEKVLHAKNPLNKIYTADDLNNLNVDHYHGNKKRSCI